MGFHSWTNECPYCGYDAMIVYSDGNLYFDEICPICGYARWGQERIPDDDIVKIAIGKLSEMDEQEKQQVMEQYCEDGIVFMDRRNKKWDF